MSDPKKPDDAPKKADPAPAVKAAPDPAEDVNPSETVPGGRFIRGTTYKGGKHYGGHIGDANGKILAVFGPKQENTGRIEDGKPPTDDDE